MMKRIAIFAMTVFIMTLLSCAIMLRYSSAFDILDERYQGEVEVFEKPQEMLLRVSCSAQVYEAIGKEVFIKFEGQTGIKVTIRLDYYIASSDVSLDRLVHDFSDIAATTRKLDFNYGERGYVETPFCRDPLAVITNKECTILNLSEQEVREIFSGYNTNWKALGGPDQPIIVVVPGRYTGAYMNFSLMVMKLREIKYDFMTHRSTMAIKAVEHFPWAISFITQAATVDCKNIKMINIDGLSPKDKNYPYSQTFYLVTKGEPFGPARIFIDFIFSEEIAKLMIKKGMSPWER